MHIEVIETTEIDGNWYKLVIDGKSVKCYNHTEKGYKDVQADYDNIIKNNGSTIFETRQILSHLITKQS